MCDGEHITYASTIGDSDNEYLCENNVAKPQGAGGVTKIELRVKAYCSRLGYSLYLDPYVGTQKANRITIPLVTDDAPDEDRWSDWYTVEFIQPSTPFSWSYVEDLECDVISEGPTGLPHTTFCSIIQIRVTFDWE